MGVGVERHAPAALPPGKTRYPLYRGLARPLGRSGRMSKISPPTGIRSPDRPARSESLYRLSYRGPSETLNGYLLLNSLNGLPVDVSCGTATVSQYFTHHGQNSCSTESNALKAMASVNGGSNFLRNVGEWSRNRTASHSIRQ